jgi:surface protein
MEERRRYFITTDSVIKATYDVISTSANTLLLGDSFNLNSIDKMLIDGVEVTKTKSYKFSSTGNHTVTYKIAEDVTSLAYIFYKAVRLYKVDFSRYSTRNLTDMSRMFCYCENLISNGFETYWDTRNVTTFSNCFYGCKSLEKLDVSGFDTSNCTDLSSMFDSCTGMTTLEGLANWNVSKVTTLRYFLSTCTSLTSVRAAFLNWDTSNVTTMLGMFQEDKLLLNIDLSKCDTSKVTDMSYMFRWCYGLTQVTMGGDVSKVTSVTNMFTGITTVGNLIYNSKYTYTKIINQKPSKWTVTAQAL